MNDIENQKQKKHTFFKLIFFVLFIAVLVFLGIRRFVIQNQTQFIATPVVNVTNIKKRKIEKKSSVMGTIMPNDTFYVVNKVAGEIKEIYVENGQKVKKGDKICEIDNSKQIDAAYIQYDTTKKSFERIEKLYKSGDVSKQNYEQAKAQYDAAKLNYDTQVEYATPVAVGDGVIENTNMTKDVTISTGTVLCYITGNGSKEIQFGVTERVLAGINVSDKVVIEKNNKTYSAYISDKANLINSSTGLFNIKATLTDDNNFASGVMAKVSFVFDKKDNTYVLPRDIVYFENGKPYVYVVVDNKITKKFFEQGIDNTNEIEVLDGLSEDDNIICTWNNDLTVGSNIDVNKNIDINELFKNEEV